MTSPFRSGTAFAVTVAVGYAACTAIFWIWPDAAVNFMNALFHGLDFRRLQAGPQLFSFGSFLYALMVTAAWAFILGTLFGWIFDRLSGDGRR